MITKRPTQVDVAKLAGVSRATVSYVLNDQMGQKIPISAETRQRVMDAIIELGYEPDSSAQSLRRGHTKIIGVIFPVIQNPFYWNIFAGISSELQSAGYSLHLSQHSEKPEHESSTLRELIQQRVDGFILLTSVKSEASKIRDYLLGSDRPVVQLTATGSVFDNVIHGYASGTRELMSYLLPLGHERIGFVYGVFEESLGHDRLFVYREILQEAGLWNDGIYEAHCGDTLEDGYQAARSLLSRPDRPTALLVINDMLAIAVMRAAHDLGLRIPEDVSVAGFDDIPFANYTIPRLTTVSGEAEESGRESVRLLLKRLAEPDLPLQSIAVDVRLIIRESTGPVPR